MCCPEHPPPEMVPEWVPVIFPPVHAIDVVLDTTENPFTVTA